MHNYTTVFKFLVIVCFLSIVSIQSAANAAGNKDRIKENITILKKTKACPGCDLKGAVLNREDLSGANLQGADLTDAKLFLTNLSGANLRGAHLQRAIFGGADLAGADLRGADLTGADINTAYLAGTKFDGEFIKTKPYEEAGLPDVEKKTYVDDTVRPKKIEKNKGVTEISNTKQKTEQKGPSGGQADSITAEDMPKKPVKPANFPETSAKKSSAQASKNGNEKSVEDNQLETSAPSMKTVRPIKKVVIEEKAKSSEKTEVEGPATARNVSMVGEENQKPKSAETTSTKQEISPAKESEAEGTVAEAKTGSKESSEVEAKGQDQSNTSIASNNTASDEKSSGSTEKTGDKELASSKESAPDQQIVEKDLLPGKETIMKPALNTEVGTSKAVTDDKSKNLKKLLDTKKCYHCDLSGLDLSGKNLSGADLEGANLKGCNLEKTDLSEAILKGASLVDANLKKADLEEADLYKADFSGANLTDVKLDDAKTDETIFDGATGKQK